MHSGKSNMEMSGNKMFNVGIFDPDVQQSYKDQWKENGWIAIDGILNLDYLEEIQRSVPELNYDYRGGVNEWYETVSANSPAEGKLLQQRVSTKTQPGDFSYFHRIHTIDKETAIPNAYTHDFATGIAYTTLEGAAFRDWVQDISGFENLKTFSPTFSYYKYDNWITPHYDPKRKIAYLFYFTRKWKKEYGGELCILDDQNRVTTTIMPLANRLVMIDVSKPEVNKHFVSPISFIAPTPRYSFIGWFS
jgi:hypothetical protein